METHATKVHQATRGGIRSLFRPSALSIRLRLIACFILIVFFIIAADAVAVWQYWQIEALAQRVSKTDQISDAVVRVHIDVDTFRDSSFHCGGGLFDAIPSGISIFLSRSGGRKIGKVFNR